MIKSMHWCILKHMINELAAYKIYTYMDTIQRVHVL